MVEFREREAEKDRAQEYKMAQLYMSTPRFQHPPMDYSINYCGATSGQFPFGSPQRPVSSSGQNMMVNSSTVIRGANQHQSIGSSSPVRNDNPCISRPRRQIPVATVTPIFN